MKTLSHYTFNNSILQEKRHKAKQPYAKSFLLVRLTGIEPVTRSLGNCCSILLSYRRMYTLLYRF